MLVREATPLDATELAELIQQVENTSQYMLWEPGERTIQPKNQQQKMIEKIQGEDNSTILVAEQDDHLIGYLFAIGGKPNKTKHSVYLVVGIHQEYRGKGVGSLLFNELDHWAVNHTIRRLELTVAIRNEPGIALYKKMGFNIEGIKRESLYIDGKYIDEYFLAKILK